MLEPHRSGSAEQAYRVPASSQCTRSSLPEKPAILTSGATLFNTFEPSPDKFEGLARTYSGKAGDDFVAWVIEKFTDGPQDRGTFLNGLMTDLKNVRQLMDDRATQVKILKEQYERDSWELLDDDAKVMMEDTHSLRKV